MKSGRLNSKLKNSIYKILKTHNGRTKTEKVASYGTRTKRREVILGSFSLLDSIGFHLNDVHSLKGRHIKALVKEWENKKLSSSTIADRLSVLRVLACWLGKDGMVESFENYSSCPGGRPAKTLVATESRCWSDNGVCVATKIEEVFRDDPYVGIQLELQRVFGLRAREAWLLHPTTSDFTTYLYITDGTKNGRPRAVPIDSPEKRQILLKAKSMAGSKLRCMIPTKYSLAQWRNRFYYVCAKHGISRKDGITPHGLRHEYANDNYEEETGNESPVRGQIAGEVRLEDDIVARRKISQMLGHARESITGAYLGSRMRRRPHTKDWDLRSASDD